MTDSATHKAIDPVCGMTVEPDAARRAGLVAEHDGVTYYFCGKGCLLEFHDDPTPFLDRNAPPSM